MKKVAFVLLMVFVATQAFAADFAPSPMKISAPAAVSYGFDGSTLEVPVQITGTPANAMLLVYTKDQGAAIGKVQNGHLGWHYVNSIDTCLYMGASANYDIGSSTIKWDGKDSDGTAVAKGEYTYYIWGFDNVTFKIPVTRQVSPQPWGRVTMVEYNEDGSPKAQPEMYQVSGGRGGDPGYVERTNKKWIVGSDPDDAGLLETCVNLMNMDTGKMAFLPSDHTQIFKAGLDNTGNYRAYAFEWVPNGAAINNTDWGDEGEVAFSVGHGLGWDFGPGIVSDGGDYLLLGNGDLGGATTEAEIVYLDVADGTELKRLDVADWFVSLEDAEGGGQSSSGPAQFELWGQYMILGSHSSCMNLMMDIQYEEDDDAIMWANDNGDYTGDHNFEEDSEKPWMCNDYNVGPYKYNVVTGEQGFTAFPSFDMGAVSFGLYAPDGTGLGYHALAGETAAQKLDTEIISYGSAYDGLLVSNNSAEDDKVGFFWVGQDTAMGVITSGVAVEDEASAFAVAQNSPNPFNPTTTIGFSVPDAGDVSVDVFNVAGQKVDTIASEFMSAGSHSATWDANGFSAGVYFYTVKAGSFTKTMKMTLIK